MVVEYSEISESPHVTQYVTYHSICNSFQNKEKQTNIVLNTHNIFVTHNMDDDKEPEHGSNFLE